MSALLEVRGLSKRFGNLAALSDFDLSVEGGQLVALIGPNGAGKSTAFGCISGAIKPSSGNVRFRGTALDGMPYHRVAALGLSRTYQVVQTFAGMTVLEATMVGSFLRHRRTADARAAAYAVLELAGLRERAGVAGASLTIADKKRLELARALATEPSLLLLDEVMAGLTPSEAHEAVSLLRALLARGLTIVMVEHVMEIVMPLAHEVVVLSAGRTLFHGAPQAAVRDPAVIEAYLGTRHPAAAGGAPR